MSLQLVDSFWLIPKLLYPALKSRLFSPKHSNTSAQSGRRRTHWRDLDNRCTNKSLDRKRGCVSLYQSVFLDLISHSFSLILETVSIIVFKKKKFRIKRHLFSQRSPSLSPHVVWTKLKHRVRTKGRERKRSREREKDGGRDRERDEDSEEEEVMVRMGTTCVLLFLFSFSFLLFLLFLPHLFSGCWTDSVGCEHTQWTSVRL